MYRVISKTLHIQDGQRRRTIHKGPWQPVQEWAEQWALYLRSTGLYDTVLVESNRQNATPQHY